MPDRLKPKKPWTRKTRLAASTKSLRSASMRSRRRTPAKELRSREHELVAPRRDIMDRLRIVVSKIVTFDVKQCPTCKRIKRGDGWNMTASHVFPCRIAATAYDIFPGGNVVPQCLDCNIDHSQRDSEPLLSWFKRTHGNEKLALVQRRWDRSGPSDVVDLDAKLTICKEILEMMTSGTLALKDLIVDFETGWFELPNHLNQLGSQRRLS